MESFKFQLNIEENEEIKDNDTSIKLDNGLKVISKKRNVTVYLNSKTNPASIIKEIKIKNDKEKAKLNEFYKSENPLLKRDHKNILTLLSRKEVNSNTFQFNYMYYPVNLQEFVKKKNEFSEEELQQFTRQLLNGLNILTNKRKVSTFLLNPENIYIDEKPNHKIIPVLKYFNTNLILSENIVCENQEYLPPELLNSNSVTIIEAPCHFWALGILIFKLFFGYSPFNSENKDISRDEYISRVNKGEYVVNFNKPISLELILLIQNLLQCNPNRRIGWDDVQKNTFLTKAFNQFHMIHNTEGIKLSIYNNECVSYFLYNQLSGITEQINKSKDFLKISNIDKIQDSNFFSSKIEIDISEALNNRNSLKQTIISSQEQNKLE